VIRLSLSKIDQTVNYQDNAHSIAIVAYTFLFSCNSALPRGEKLSNPHFLRFSIVV
jgi:hypothetical protein